MRRQIRCWAFRAADEGLHAARGEVDAPDGVVVVVGNEQLLAADGEPDGGPELRIAREAPVAAGAAAVAAGEVRDGHGQEVGLPRRVVVAVADEEPAAGRADARGAAVVAVVAAVALDAVVAAVALDGAYDRVYDRVADAGVEVDAPDAVVAVVGDEEVLRPRRKAAGPVQHGLGRGPAVAIEAGAGCPWACLLGSGPPPPEPLSSKTPNYMIIVYIYMVVGKYITCTYIYVYYDSNDDSNNDVM